MGWAQRLSRDRRLRERFAPTDEMPTLDRVRQLAAGVRDLDHLDRMLETVPNTILRAEIRKLVAPMVGTP